jgi:hypothetical protein
MSAVPAVQRQTGGRELHVADCSGDSRKRSCAGPSAFGTPKRYKNANGKGSSKSSCPEMVQDCTILCNSRKIGQILDGSQCLVTGCRGFRRIIDCDVSTHGGCGVFALQCGTCKVDDLWESGTHYQADVYDDRTARYAEATLLYIGILFGGGGNTSYEEICSALGLNGFSEKCNRGYFWRLYHAAETVMKESQELCHSFLDQQTKHGFQNIVGLFDGAWLHRGYGSQHGSAAIVDVNFGFILWLGHKSKDTSLYGRVPHKMSSGMMEVVILGDLLVQAKGPKWGDCAKIVARWSHMQRTNESALSALLLCRLVGLVRRRRRRRHALTLAATVKVSVTLQMTSSCV